MKKVWLEGPGKISKRPGPSSQIKMASKSSNLLDRKVYLKFLKCLIRKYTKFWSLHTKHTTNQLLESITVQNTPQIKFKN